MDPMATPALNSVDSVMGVAADTGVGDEVGVTLVVVVRNAALIRLTFDGDDAVGTVDCDIMELSVAAVMLLSISPSSRKLRILRKWRVCNKSLQARPTRLQES